MPNESQIDRIEQLYDDMARLGGKAERTAILTNVLVINAAPTGLTGRIIIRDPRDGDYVPALTVPGIVYANNDLVNVLFVEGTEPLAFQQGSGSSGNNAKVYQLWESDFGAAAAEADASGNITFHRNIILDGIIANSIIGSGNNQPDLGSSTASERLGDFFIAGGKGHDVNGDYTFTIRDAWNLKDSTQTWLTFQGGVGTYAILAKNSTAPDIGSTTAAQRFGSIFVAGSEKIDANGSFAIESTAGSEIVINNDGDDVDFRVEVSGVTHALFVQGSDGKVGINTATIPHGAIGAAMLALDGTASSVAAGPHQQWTVSTDDYPVRQDLNYAHDNINVVLDAYFDGSWKSSDAGSNFLISKISDKLHIQSDVGIAQGSVITWDTLLSFDPTNIRVGVNNQSPLKKLHVGPGTDATFQSYDGIYVAINDFAQVAVRNNSTDVEGGMFAHTSIFYMGTWTNHSLIFDTNNTDALAIDTSQNVGIGIISGLGAKLHIDQASTTATIPVLTLDQADLSEEYIDFITASTGASDPVDTVTAVGTAYARLRVAVNGTFKYIQLYNA